MARTQLTLDGLDLNDGVNYFLMPGIDVGSPLLTYDEYAGYGGTAAQTNVSTAHLIAVTIPIDVRSTTIADLGTKVAAINTKIVSCTFASHKHLVYAGTTYDIVHSPQVAPPHDELYAWAFIARFVITLNRLP